MCRQGPVIFWFEGITGPLTSKPPLPATRFRAAARGRPCRIREGTGGVRTGHAEKYITFQAFGLSLRYGAEAAVRRCPSADFRSPPTLPRSCFPSAALRPCKGAERLPGESRWRTTAERDYPVIRAKAPGQPRAERDGAALARATMVGRPLALGGENWYAKVCRVRSAHLRASANPA